MSTATLRHPALCPDRALRIEALDALIEITLLRDPCILPQHCAARLITRLMAADMATAETLPPDTLSLVIEGIEGRSGGHSANAALRNWQFNARIALARGSRP